MFRHVCSLLVAIVTVCAASTEAQERREEQTFSESTTDGADCCYLFNIRLLSVSEELMAPLRSGKPTRLLPSEPFAGAAAVTGGSGEDIVLRRSETLIRKPLDQELVLLTEEQMKRLMHDVQAQRSERGVGGRVMLAPTLLVEEGQTGTVTSGREIFWHTSETEVSTEPVFEGTQISVRAIEGDGVGIPVDVRVQVSQLVDVKDVPVGADGVFARRPEEKIFVLEFSAILTAEKSHVAVLPLRASEPSGKTGSPISLVSRIVGKAEEPPQFSVWVISCSLQRAGED